MKNRDENPTQAIKARYLKTGDTVVGLYTDLTVYTVEVGTEIVTVEFDERPGFEHYPIDSRVTVTR